MKRTLASLMIGLSVLMGATTAAVALDYRALKEACDSFDAKRCEKQMRVTDPVTLFFYGKDEVGKKNIFVSTDAICLSAEMGFSDGAEACIRQAKLGNSVAQFHVGRLLGLGLGLEQNFELSYMWLNISAQKGHGPAVEWRELVGRKLSDAAQDNAKLAANTCLLSKYVDCKARIKIKSNKNGALINETFIQSLLRKANRGDAYSMYLMGAAYSLGDGVVEDKKEAAKWYRQAAEKGDVNGQVNIAYFYEIGVGVLQDYKEAAKWYQLAAEQGNATAQNNLGLMYEYGEGVIQDNVIAHMWLNIGASNGSTKGTSNRDSLAKRMTAAQLAEAQKLARECVAKNYKGC